MDVSQIVPARCPLKETPELRGCRDLSFSTVVRFASIPTLFLARARAFIMSMPISLIGFGLRLKISRWASAIRDPWVLHCLPCVAN